MSALRVNSGTAIASGEEVRAALRELHNRAALMQLQPAALRSGAAKGEWSGERVQHALHCGMLSVLDLDPVRRATRTVRPVTVFRDESLQAHQAGVAEEVGTDFALLEV